MNNVFSIRAVIREANTIMKPKRWGIVKQYAVVAFVFAIILMVLFGQNGVIGSIIGVLFTTKWALSYANKGSFSYDELFEGVTLKNFAYFVCSLSLVVLIVLGGFILLIIPGIMFAVRYMFASYFVVEKGIGPRASLQESARITRGNRWKLFFFMIVVGLINVIGLLCLVVGVFFTAPLTRIATALVYKKLSSPVIQA